jgi:DNA modification methylase
MTTKLTLTIELKINPEYAKLVPPLSAVKYVELKQDIKENGLWHSIDINKDYFILDGHHRFKICRELGIEPKIRFRNFTPLEEISFVINSNRKRRQLNKFQEVEMLLNTRTKFEELAKEKQRRGGINKVSQKSDEPIRVDEQIGKLANVSRDMVRKVEFLEQNATVEKLDRLRQGQAKISKEYMKIQKAKKIAIAQQIAICANPCSNNGLFQLLLGDMNGVSKNIPDESIDLIFTDPPYAEKYLYLYDDLAIMSCRVLKLGGSLVMYIPDACLDKITLMMSDFNDLKFNGWIAVHHNGHVAKNWKTGMWENAKLLLWYYKGDKPTKFHDLSNYIESQPVDKYNHKWEQSTIEVEEMIKPLTVEGMTVLDPFMGSGTTRIATLQLNRKFIGIEIDEAAFITARAAIQKLDAI